MSDNKPQQLAFHPVVETPDGRVYVSPHPIKMLPPPPRPACVPP